MGILKGFPKSVGRVGSRLHGFPCFPYSVISMACFSPGRCWIYSYIDQRNAPYSQGIVVVIVVHRQHLAGKIAVITGGSSGIGLATAKRFVEEGAHVVITGRREKELKEAATFIKRNVTTVVGDVAALVKIIERHPRRKQNFGRRWYLPGPCTGQRQGRGKAAG